MGGSNRKLTLTPQRWIGNQLCYTQLKNFYEDGDTLIEQSNYYDRTLIMEYNFNAGNLGIKK